MDRQKLSCVLLTLAPLLWLGACSKQPSEPSVAKSSDDAVQKSHHEAEQAARYPRETLEAATLLTPTLPQVETANKRPALSPQGDSSAKLVSQEQQLNVHRLPSTTDQQPENEVAEMQIDVGEPIDNLRRLPAIDQLDVASASDEPVVIADKVLIEDDSARLPEPTLADRGSVWTAIEPTPPPQQAIAPDITEPVLPAEPDELARLPELLPEHEEVVRPTPVAATTTVDALRISETLESPRRIPSPTSAEEAQSRPLPQLPAHPTVDPMRAVNAQALREIRRAFALAERGATYSARIELIEALRTISQALDMRDGTREHTDALKRGFWAMEEAEDFHQRGLADELDMEVLVASHRTPVLKQADLAEVTPLVALQKYLTYSQEQLTLAGGRQPTASLALYGLGRLQEDLAGEQEDTRPQAMVFHQAAVMVDEMNYKAANELGVLLARYGQHQQARNLLAHSVRVRPLPESWRNLAKVHQRLGETDLARRAINESQLAERGGRLQNGAVRWVDPATLAGTIETSQPVRRVPQDTETESQSQTLNASHGESEGIMRLIPWMRRSE